MSWIIIGDRDTAVFACNTSDTAFGPIFYGGCEEAKDFEEFLGQDPRCLSEETLMEAFTIFTKHRNEEQQLTEGE
jgi:hypothetical protein